MATCWAARSTPRSRTSTPASCRTIKAGKLRALAITSAKRSPLLPDVPTLDESGVKGVTSIRGRPRRAQGPAGRHQGQAA
jgi:tripartite-type tricarboxylate transporter receptor subunit TctC